MKKILIIVAIVAIAFILTSMKASAFSFVDVFKFLNRDSKVEEEAKTELDFREQFLAVEKYENWKNAFDNQNIDELFSDERNFSFAEAELNYLIDKRLNEIKYPPAKNVKIYLKDGLIKVRGYSLKRFFNGRIELDIAPVQKHGKLALDVKRVRFRNIYFPKFIASFLLKEEMEDTYAFLYSHPDYKKLNIVVEEDKLELKYSN